jgi:hypothetical protein
MKEELRLWINWAIVLGVAWAVVLVIALIDLLWVKIHLLNRVEDPDAFGVCCFELIVAGSWALMFTELLALAALARALFLIGKVIANKFGRS